MNGEENKVLEQAQKMLAESGKLDISVRRKIWQEMGALEERAQDSPAHRRLTEPLKKRALLALACAKKVMPIWCKCDPDDKRPQKLIKKALAYLDGKISVQELNAEIQSGVIDDFTALIDEGEIAASAALAAWDAAIVALEDEASLEPWRQDVTDDKLDSYDWDAAKNACAAFRDAYSDGDNGKCAVREMKFWAWYLEEAAKLFGIGDYRFPPKFIKAFQEKQNPPKPVPEEVTLESFADFLDLGEYVYHTKTAAEKGEEDDFDYYEMFLRLGGDYGICPVCRKKVYEVQHAGLNSRLDWYDHAFPAKGPQLGIRQFDLMFRCPDHPDKLIYLPLDVYKNVKAAVKCYIRGAGRLEKLLDELERRKTTKYFKVWGDSITVNGREFFQLEKLEENKEELGLVGAGWRDEEKKVYGLDIRQFLPVFYLYGRPYGDFMQYQPEKVQKNEDGTVTLRTDEYHFRCTMENGEPVYVEIRSVFRVWVENKEEAALFKVLMESFHLSAAAAEKAVQSAKSRSREWELEPLTALAREEAEHVVSKLREAGVKCRIIPDRF